MKKYIFLSLLILLYCDPVLAYQYTPIKIEIVESFEQKKQKLIDKYGEKLFDDCYYSNQSCIEIIKTSTSDPMYAIPQEKYCLSTTEDCIKNASIVCSNHAYKINGICICPDGQTILNNQCVTYDVGCKIVRGEHSYSTGRKSNGHIECSCEEGYDYLDGDKCTKINPEVIAKINKETTVLPDPENNKGNILVKINRAEEIKDAPKIIEKISSEKKDVASSSKKTTINRMKIMNLFNRIFKAIKIIFNLI